MHGVEIPYASEDEWLDLRRQGVGGSDIAAIIGRSPWQTPFGVWTDKIGAGEKLATEAMRMGKRIENFILDLWEEETGEIAGKRGTLWRHPVHEGMMATVDAIAPTREAVVEAKNDASWSWDEIPLHYQAQGQWQMLVTGLGKVEFAVLHRGNKLKIYLLDADAEDQGFLAAAAARFWTMHVEPKIAPPVEAGDNRHLAAVWPFHSEARVEVEGGLVKELIAVRNNLDQLERRKDELEATLKTTLAEAEVGTVEGERAISWRTQTHSDLDRLSLREEMPEIYDKFVVKSTRRVFRVHAKEESV